MKRGGTLFLFARKVNALLSHDSVAPLSSRLIGIRHL